MFEKIRRFLIDDSELEGGTLRLLSLVFLFISGAMCFFEYTKIIPLLWWSKEVSVKLIPEFLSAIVALVLVTPLYMRDILKWNRSIYTIISFVLILLVFASFVQLVALGGPKAIVIISILTSAVLLSWLGIKEVAAVSWILALAAAIVSAWTNGVAMGFYGFIYITSGSLGLILHSRLNPGQLLQGIRNEYSSGSEKLLNKIELNS